MNATFELVPWLAYRPLVAEPNLLINAKWWMGFRRAGPDVVVEWRTG